MTTQTHAPVHAATSRAHTTVEAGPDGAGWLLRPISRLGGIAMIAAPLLLVGGIVSSPPQDGRDQAAYIASLARDPLLSSVSASLLHYGWVALSLGLLAAMTLVRGTRGRRLALIGGIGGAFTTVQISGVLLNDWFLTALGNHASSADAVAISAAMGDPAFTVWLQTGKLAIVVPVILFVGLARAGVISWWLVPVALLPQIVPFVLGGLVGGGAPGAVIAAVSGLLCYAPVIMVGVRLLGRSRLA